MPYTEVPAFIGTLRAPIAGVRSSRPSERLRLAFELMILTVARPVDVAHATRSEFDLANSVWTIPADRLRYGPRQVPLAPRCVEIVFEAESISSGDRYLFAGRNSERPLSNMALGMYLRRIGVKAIASGFRASFEEWALKTQDPDTELLKCLLGRRMVGLSAVEQANSMMFEQHRRLLNDWSEYLSQNCNEHSQGRRGGPADVAVRSDLWG